MTDADVYRRELRFARAVTEPVWVSWLIAALLALVGVALWAWGQLHAGPFGGELLHEHLLYFGHRGTVELAHGEVWRLLGSAFLHVSPFHFFVNFALWVLVAPVVERMFGPRRFVVLFVACVLLGNLFGVAAEFFGWTTAGGRAVGASAGVVGVSAAGFAFLTRRREALNARFVLTYGTRLTGVVIFWLVAALFATGSDQAAHLGGCVAGLAAGALSGGHMLSGEAGDRRWRLPAWLAWSLLCWSLFAVAAEAARCGGSPEALTGCYPELRDTN